MQGNRPDTAAAAGAVTMHAGDLCRAESNAAGSAASHVSVVLQCRIPTAAGESAQQLAARLGL